MHIKIIKVKLFEQQQQFPSPFFLLFISQPLRLHLHYYISHICSAIFLKEVWGLETKYGRFKYQSRKRIGKCSDVLSQSFWYFLMTFKKINLHNLSINTLSSFFFYFLVFLKYKIRYQLYHSELTKTSKQQDCFHFNFSYYSYVAYK